MTRRRCALLLLAAAFLAGTCAGMYEDEARAIDWGREHIGGRRLLLSTFGNTLHVATDSALAALSLETGDILWRRVLPTGESASCALRVSSKMFVLGSSAEKGRVTAWAAADGAFLWDAAVPAQPIAFAAATTTPTEAQTTTTTAIAVLLANGDVVALNAKSGAALWTAAAPCPHASALSAAFAVAGVDAETGALHAALLDPATGALVSSHTTADSHCVAALGASLLGRTAVCVSPERSVVVALSAANGAAANVAFDQPRCEAPAKLSGAVLDVCGAFSVLVEDADSSDLVRFSAKSAGKADESSSCVAAAHPDAGKLFTLCVSGSAATVSGKRIANAEPLLRRGTPLSAVATGNRALVLMADHSLHLVSGLECTWSREEALAEVEAVEFVHLPPPDVSAMLALRGEIGSATADAGVIRVLAQYVRRIRFDVSQLAAKLKSLFAPSKPASDKQASSLVKDSFGFDQMLVAATESGALYGMRTVGGHIAWRNFLGEPQSSKPRKQALYTLRPTSASCNAPELALVRVFDTWTQISKFNGLNGDILGTYDAPFPAVQSGVLLSSRFPEALATLVLLERTAEGTVASHYYGSFPDADDLKNAFFFLVDKEVGYAEGFAASAANDGPLVSLWRRAFPPDQESIVAVARHHPREIFHSAAKLLGNRTMRAKYLDRNLLAIATVSPCGSGSSTLTVRLLNAVSGSVVAEVSHRRASGPVNIALTDNTAVYHFWSGGQPRLGVIDLYETVTDWRTKHASAFAMPPASAFQQTYNLRHAVVAITPTTTAHGMTAKQLLFALPASGSVVAVERRMIDTRRPFDPEAQSVDDKEVGIIPYTPLLDPPATATVTHGTVVERIRTVVTAPALLESTSLVLVLGHDLFFTRTAPAGTFDVLNSDFNFVALILTVAGLTVVAAILNYLQRRKAVDKLFL